MNLRKEIVKECGNFFAVLMRGKVKWAPSHIGRFCTILNSDSKFVEMAKKCSHIDRCTIDNSDRALIYTVIYFCLYYDFPLIVDCILNEYKCVKGLESAHIFHAWISTMQKTNFGDVLCSIVAVK